MTSNKKEFMFNYIIINVIIINVIIIAVIVIIDGQRERRIIV